MVHVERSKAIRADRKSVYSLVADIPSWPGMFPAYKSVAAVRSEGDASVYEADLRREGRVRIVRRAFPDDRIEDEAESRQWKARTVYTLSSSSEGTVVTVAEDAELKGLVARMGRGPVFKAEVSIRLEALLSKLKEKAEKT